MLENSKMILLPAIGKQLVDRPSYRGKAEHLLADDAKGVFWEDFYRKFQEYYQLVEPIENFSEKINPYFGYFGYRWHPINYKPKYFHIGIDVGGAIGCPLKSVYKGFLEYAGEANVNGKYIIVKHPNIQTEDGFVFQSMYMHCDRLDIRFNIFQKIIREYLSKDLNFSNTPIDANEKIASLGDTGNKLKVVPHLHLQFEFVKGNKHMAINPLKLYNKTPLQNLTASLISEAEFLAFYQKHSQGLEPWRKFWADKI